MSTHDAGPVRTCVGCRERAAKHELLRVVAVDGSLIPDPASQAPGRGAHLHLRTECLELALRRRAFTRALRVQTGLSSETLREFVRHADQTETDRNWSSSS